jgi:hypothetical protein
MSTLPAIAAALLLSSACQAATLAINNLSGGTQGFAASLSGPSASFGFFGTFEDRQVAFSFVSGPDNVHLTRLRFSINLGDVAIDPIQATLSTGASVAGGINPITIGSVGPLAPTPVGQLMTLAPAVPIMLTANTNYWIHFTVPTGSAIYTINNGNAPVLESGWTLGNTCYYAPDFGGSWTEVTSGPQARVELTVEAVPEPSSPLLGLVAAGMVLRRRRR